MDKIRLAEIIEETTSEFRKGPEVVTEKHPDLEVTHIYAMPHKDEAPDTKDQHDLHFIVVAVDRELAKDNQNELEQILADYPEPERLAGGPSYIEIGAVIGSQDLALRLFALGETLGMWQFITPERFHITGPEADQLAGQGMIMMSGWKPQAASVN